MEGKEMEMGTVSAQAGRSFEANIAFGLAIIADEKGPVNVNDFGNTNSNCLDIIRAQLNCVRVKAARVLFYILTTVYITRDGF